jgi:hypothetical protein
MEKALQANCAHGFRELRMPQVLNSNHSSFARGENVFFTVVDKEDVAGIFAQAFCGMVIDGKIGLGEAEPVGEGVVVEALEPVKAGQDAGFDRIADVGKDSGLVASVLELGCPLYHVEVELGPNLDIGCEHGGEDGRIERAVEIAGNRSPIGGCVESSAVIRVAMTPVGYIEVCLIDLQEGLHAFPGVGIGRPRENEAVVEENCVDDRHSVDCRARRVG